MLLCRAEEVEEFRMGKLRGVDLEGFGTACVDMDMLIYPTIALLNFVLHYK